MAPVTHLAGRFDTVAAGSVTDVSVRSIVLHEDTVAYAQADAHYRRRLTAALARPVRPAANSRARAPVLVPQVHVAIPAAPPKVSAARDRRHITSTRRKPRLASVADRPLGNIALADAYPSPTDTFTDSALLDLLAEDALAYAQAHPASF